MERGRRAGCDLSGSHSAGKLPKSVIIIGSERLASSSQQSELYGTEVTIVEMLPSLVPLEDPEVSAELAKAFKKKGFKVMTGTKVESVEAKEGKAVVRVTGEDGEKTLEAEQALVAIGFRPNGKGLGLEELGVEIGERVKSRSMSAWQPTSQASGQLASNQAAVCHVVPPRHYLKENIAERDNRFGHEMLRACDPQIAPSLTEAMAKERL
jgi:dihydrolipoamide dehydrogenase